MNFAQWSSQQDFQRFMQKPETQAAQKVLAALALPVSPALNSVDAVHRPG